MKKRQYYFQQIFPKRSSSDYVLESTAAESQRKNINGHFGLSVLHRILDIPLPKSILIDYMHVCLLRHTRAIVGQLYNRLKPVERIALDDQLRKQPFPHTFGRKMRPISDSHIKLDFHVTC